MVRRILSTIVLTLCSLHAADADTNPEIAVIVRAGESFSPQAWQAMETESKRIAKQAGLRVRFVAESNAASQEFNDLVVFRMTGCCEMDSFTALLDERGPLAWAFTADGNVLPFGEVKCDRVRESIKPVLDAADHRRANEIFGRALGRVIAHELCNGAEINRQGARHPGALAGLAPTPIQHRVAARRPVGRTGRRPHRSALRIGPGIAHGHSPNHGITDVHSHRAHHGAVGP